MNNQKCVLVGVTGGIAAYKACDLVSKLVKKGYDVQVLMSENATKFVAPLTFETLSKHRIALDTFDRNFEYSTEHISLAKKADVFVVAPATANFIGKVANGLADDMLTTTFLAATCPKIICPAMNTGMLENPITQDNITKCKKYGMQIIESDTGYLACGDIGKGRLVDNDVILQAIEEAMTEKLLAGKKVLITAGPTQEAIDPVRYITNHSSGKMGYALARQAHNMGAEVTLVSGKTNLNPVLGVKTIEVTSALDMAEAVKKISDKQDIIIMSAAIADFTPSKVAKDKIKKTTDMSQLNLSKTEDILAYLGKHKKNKQVLVGFAMETQDLLKNAKAKLEKKNCDLIVANNLKTKGAGFAGDTNVVTIISKKETKEYELMSKDDLAKTIIMDYLVKEGK